MTTRTTIVGVFPDRAQAQKAIAELKQAGFRDDEIGMTVRDEGAAELEIGRPRDEAGNETYAGEGGAAGMAAGAGLGALWGLGIVAIGLPAIGPAIAGGALAAVLTSAVAGAAAAGIAGALIGLGIPKEEAEYYENEFKAGRTLVAVKTTTRQDEARGIIRQHGGYDIASRPGEGTHGMEAGATGYAQPSESVLRQDTPHESTVTATGIRAGHPTRSVDVPVEAEVVGGSANLGAEAGGSAMPVDVPVTEEEVKGAPARKGTGKPPRKTPKQP